MIHPRFRGGAGGTGLAAATLLLAGLVSSACHAPEAAPALGHTADSPRHLAGELLAALAGRDRERLEQLAVTEHEFREYVWLELPGSRPERAIPVAYAWSEHSAKSRGHLAALLERRGGQRLELVDVSFEGGLTSYGPFTFYRDTVLTVRDPSGATTKARLFGSVIERDGRFKIFSYIVD